LILSLFLQNIVGFSAIYTSFYFLSLTISYALVSPFAGSLNERYSARLLITCGALLSLIPLIWLSILSPTTPYWHLLIIFSLYGISTAIVFPALLNSTLAFAPEKKKGMVSGILYMMLFTGGAIGAIIIGAGLLYFAPGYLTKQLNQHQIHLSIAKTNKLTEFVTGVRDINQLNQLLENEQLLLYKELLKNSFTQALNHIMLIAAFFTFIILLLTQFIKNEKITYPLHHTKSEMR